MTDPTNKSGIFSLSDVRVRQRNNKWIMDLSTIWSQNPNAPSQYYNLYTDQRTTPNSARILGGWSGTVDNTISSVGKLDFTTDTFSVSSSNGIKNYLGTGLSTNQHGYAFHGRFVNPVNSSTYYNTSIYRFDWSNDASSLSIFSSLLYYERIDSVSEGTENYGYFFGGKDSSVTRSEIYRIDYSSSTAATLVSNINAATWFDRFSSFSNSTYAWIKYSRINNNPANYASTSSAVGSYHRFSFSNDTGGVSSRGSFNENHENCRGIVSNHNYAWITGGYNSIVSGYYNYTSSIERVDYSNDTVVSTRSTSMFTKNISNMCSGNRENGYWFGGSTLYEKRETSGTNLTSSTSTRSYIDNRCEQLKYASDTIGTSHRASNSTAARNNATAVSAASKGSIPFISAPSPSYIPAPTPTAQWIVGSPNDKGYYFGAFLTGTSSLAFDSKYIQKFSFTNETPSISTSSFLRGKRVASGATGNASYALIYGGFIGTFEFAATETLSSVERFDYSNDTASPTSRGSITLSNDFGNGHGVVSSAAISSSTNAYFTMGLKWNLANFWSLPSASGGSGLNTQMDHAQMTTDSPTQQSASALASLHRWAYSNDTYTFIPNVGQPWRWREGTIGDGTYGWWIGGLGYVHNRFGVNPASNWGTAYSDITRMTFASDTSTMSQRSNMLINGFNIVSFGNATYGWIYTGKPENNYDYTAIQRFTFANDTVGVSERGSGPSNLEYTSLCPLYLLPADPGCTVGIYDRVNTRHITGTSNKDYGVLIGRSYMERMSFSNETWNTRLSTSIANIPNIPVYEYSGTAAFSPSANNL